VVEHAVVSAAVPDLAVPGLELVARLEVRVGAPVPVGRSTGGERRLVPILGGRVLGPRLTGSVVAGGCDVQLVRPDGVTEIESRYLIELDDGTRLFVHDAGVRHAPPDVVAALARGEAVDPALVYSRTRVSFETDAPPYAWLTRDLFVGTGARRGDHVALAFHHVS
jgi:hypothetical protein